MLKPIMFFMIGKYISAPTPYWVVFTLYCVFYVLGAVIEAFKDVTK